MELQGGDPDAVGVDDVVVAAPTTWDTTYRFVATRSTTQAAMMPDRNGPFLGRPGLRVVERRHPIASSGMIMFAGDFAAAYTTVDRLGLTAAPITVLLGGTAAVHYSDRRIRLGGLGRVRRRRRQT